MVVLFVIVAALFLRGSGNKGVVYHIAPVKRGELLATISATGTVEPEEVIDVGAQVAGQINSFGKDKNGKTIDYGSVVEEGTSCPDRRFLIRGGCGDGKRPVAAGQAGVSGRRLTSGN